MCILLALLTNWMIDCAEFTTNKDLSTQNVLQFVTWVVGWGDNAEEKKAERGREKRVKSRWE